MQQIKTFLMFDGNAEEAMHFYVSLFKNSQIGHIIKYDANGPGKEGSVKMAVFTLNDQHFLCIDSYIKHEFTFTPAISLYVSCKSENEVDTLFAKLSERGQVFMPLNSYPFSKKYGWVADRFGVSWQLNFE